MDDQAEANRITQEEAEQRFLQALRSATLLKRFSTTEAVANMIVDACSQQASSTSGAALWVDGGIVRCVD
ncbi:SDR family oxidoreductase [Mangrovicella endophytica]|uniref:SDR family oxidoreductase n=1 Tax=Mangrovicella endophytica TaxID=2066697 RepID=UPI001FE1D9A3|nr:SDR family oxidoreductase [Mangrovicella endophytica]